MSACLSPRDERDHTSRKGAGRPPAWWPAERGFLDESVSRSWISPVLAIILPYAVSLAYAVSLVKEKDGPDCTEQGASARSRGRPCRPSGHRSPEHAQAGPGGRGRGDVALQPRQ